MTNKVPEQSRLKRSLNEEDIETLKKKILNDDVLVEIFRKLIRDGKRNVVIPGLKDDNWLVIRAYADGQLRELDWMDNLLNWRG